MAHLEHANLTVADPEATASLLETLFGWRVRWSGTAIHGGRSLHVGEPGTGSYLAIYRGAEAAQQAPVDSYTTRGALNHIGVVVADLDATEDKVRALGYTPGSHADYEPGRRFYFREENDIEIEVISYA
nr:VOC family protein [Pseudoroseicyclus aestuarii]